MIGYDVPEGKRLLFTDAEGRPREFHGPCRVETDSEVQLVDELPLPVDTRTDYEKLSAEQKFEGLRKHLGVTEDQVVSKTVVVEK